MKTYCKDDPHEEMDYQKYKAGKFETYKREVRNIIIAIYQTSLKDADKKRLFEEVKTIMINLKTPY